MKLVIIESPKTEKKLKVKEEIKFYMEKMGDTIEVNVIYPDGYEETVCWFKFDEKGKISLKLMTQVIGTSAYKYFNMGEGEQPKCWQVKVD